MPCFGPITGYYAADKNDNGKRSIVFKKDEKALSGVPIKLPCGRCVGCRLEHSRRWAIRCMHEKKMHLNSSFLTLTYSDENLPLLHGPLIAQRQTLSLRDYTLFMKKLRDRIGPGLRFFGCGEYGDDLGRPHYHVLLFNYDFVDRRYYKDNKRGEPLYTSRFLDNLWGLGNCVVGDVTFDSCAYVARYVVKKITGKMGPAHYQGRRPEFVTMSRRPGLGRTFFDKYKAEIYQSDSVVINGVETVPPRYYDELYKELDALRLETLKKRRLRRDRIRRLQESKPDRLRIRELCALRKSANQKREV